MEKLTDVKSTKVHQWCYGCETLKETTNVGGYDLCEDCEESRDNKTGYCSMDCQLSGSCDGSC